jgi:glutamate racemase
MVSKLSTKSSPADPIGVFDSGVGGLSILRRLRRLLPRERFVFLADQAFVPYGMKTPRQLKLRCARIVRFLLKRRCKIIVVACNTATCYAIANLRAQFAVPFVGTVPAVKPACTRSRRGVVGVISTPATAKSAMLAGLVREHGGAATVICRGCPGLEEVVERGGTRGPEVERILKRCLAPAVRARADIIVLGCTHYPFLAPVVRRISGARTIDSGAAIARRTRSLLSRSGELTHRTAGSVRYYTTGSARRFVYTASRLLKTPVTAHKVKI